MTDTIFEVSGKGIQDTTKNLTFTARALESVQAIAARMMKAGGVLGGLFGTNQPSQQNLAVMGELNAEIEHIARAIDEVNMQMAEAENYDAFLQYSSQAEGLQAEYENLIALQEEYNQTLEQGGDLPGSETDMGMEPFDRGVGDLSQSIFSLGSQMTGLGGVFDDMGMSTSNIFTQGEQLSGMFTKLASAPKLGALSGGFTKLAKLAGPVSAGIAGINVGMTAFDAIMGRSTEQIRKNIEAHREAMDLELERADLLRTGSSESIEADIAAMEDQIAVREQSRRDLQADAVNLTSTSDQLKTIIGHFAGSDKVFGDAADALKEMDDEIADLAAERDMRQAILDEVRAREEAEEAAQRVKDAEEELASIREESQQAIEDYQKQLEETFDDWLFDDARTQRERRRSEIAAEKEHAENLAGIAEQSNETIAGLQRDHGKNMREMEERLREELAAVPVEMHEEEARISQEYMESRIEEHESHLETMQKAEAQYQKDRQRMIEDHLDQLREAESSNDIVQFLQLQRDHEKAMRRASEDREEEVTEEQKQFDEAQAQRRADFQQQLAEQRQAGQERMAELRAQYEEEKAQASDSLREQIASEQAQRAEQIADAQAEHAKRRKEEAEQQKIEDKERDIERKRQLQKMEQGHKEQLQELQEREQAQLDIIHSGGRAQIDVVQKTQQALVDIMADGARAMVDELKDAIDEGTSGKARSRSNVTKFSRKPAIAAAEGAIVTEPTVTLLGEGRVPEVVMPLEPSGGLPGGMGTTMQFSFGNITLGGGVTRAEFEQTMNEFGHVVADALTDAQSGVRTPMV
jgi:hypothetical protein